MNAFTNKLLADDFIWSAIVSNLPVRSSKTRNDFIKFDCPVCHLYGQGKDRKMRCGVRKNADGVGVNCFNCGFKTRYEMGELLSRRMKSFLQALGMGDLDVNRLSHRAFQLHRMMSGQGGGTGIVQPRRYTPEFEPKELPSETKPLMEWADEGCTDPDFLAVVAYAVSRGSVASTGTMWSPDPRWRNRLIIPFHFKKNIVGWTGRLVGEATDDNPRYDAEVPADYLYNCNIMYRHGRKFLLMPEGTLDAKAIDGISPMGAKLSPNQVQWITSRGMSVIVIPDRDSSGQRLIDVALKHGWYVAFPRISRAGQNWWEGDVKDCAQAVQRYGKLFTVRSILATATNKSLEINIRRKWLEELTV